MGFLNAQLNFNFLVRDFKVYTKNFLLYFCYICTFFCAIVLTAIWSPQKWVKVAPLVKDIPVLTIPLYKFHPFTNQLILILIPRYAPLLIYLFLEGGIFYQGSSLSQLQLPSSNCLVMGAFQFMKYLNIIQSQRCLLNSPGNTVSGNYSLLH